MKDNRSYGANSHHQHNPRYNESEKVLKLCVLTAELPDIKQFVIVTVDV